MREAEQETAVVPSPDAPQRGRLMCPLPVRRAFVPTSGDGSTCAEAITPGPRWRELLDVQRYVASPDRNHDDTVPCRKKSRATLQWRSKTRRQTSRSVEAVPKLTPSLSLPSFVLGRCFHVASPQGTLGTEIPPGALRRDANGQLARSPFAHREPWQLPRRVSRNGLRTSLPNERTIQFANDDASRGT